MGDTKDPYRAEPDAELLELVMGEVPTSSDAEECLERITTNRENVEYLDKRFHRDVRRTPDEKALTGVLKKVKSKREYEESQAGRESAREGAFTKKGWALVIAIGATLVAEMTYGFLTHDSHKRDKAKQAFITCADKDYDGEVNVQNLRDTYPSMRDKLSGLSDDERVVIKNESPYKYGPRGRIPFHGVQIDMSYLDPQEVGLRIDTETMGDLAKIAQRVEMCAPKNVIKEAYSNMWIAIGGG
jgi:hypothetical protein